jgi:hypothetical protein
MLALRDFQFGDPRLLNKIDQGFQFSQIHAFNLPLLGACCSSFAACGVTCFHFHSHASSRYGYRDAPDCDAK